MKKVFLVLILIASIFTLSACKEETYATSFFDYMDTYISVNLVTKNEKIAQKHFDQIEEIYAMYHFISTSYEDLPNQSLYLSNIYQINQTLNENIEIDYELYELLEKAEEYKQLTDGYFDISIGKIVDIWKKVILDDSNEFVIEIYDQNERFLYSEIRENAYQALLLELNEIDVVDQPYTLSIIDGKYYVKINHEDVKLDLGAFSKGVATEKANQYLKNNGVTYFSISAGSSSLSVGKNISNTVDQLQGIRLTNPLSKTTQYARIQIKDLSITTSGNYEQFVMYNGLRHHHIVSPKTKMPTQYYHALTIIGEDAGFLDALSTALFSMNEMTFQGWMTNHSKNYPVEIIRFNYDETISTFLKDVLYEKLS